VVIADEAHRGQYNFAANLGKEGEFEFGFAQHIRDALPNAAFVGFTGTPVETADKVTTNVFGAVIDAYDIQQAVEDGATVPIYYEGRLAKIELPDAERPRLDEKFEEITEGTSDPVKRKLQMKWAALEALVGAEKRLKLIAKDIVDHFENRVLALPGKGMIVCMSRRICVELYKELIDLRPEWAGEKDTDGRIKVVITGSAADGPTYQPHIRTKSGLQLIAKRVKDPSDPLHLVLVRDMWLTGFDAPCVHTMYLDKPLKAHGLMQAIARVNRVYGVKPNGLVVDYLGLAAELKEALATYTAAGGRGKPTFDQEQAVAALEEKLDIVRGMVYGFDYATPLRGTAAERMAAVGTAMDFLLRKGGDIKVRFIREATDLYRAFALAAPAEAALAVAVEVGFFQAARAALAKMEPPKGGGRVRTAAELDLAVQQLVSRALVSDQVIDIFAAAGMKRPDVSVLSEQFLRDVQGMKHRSLAAELLERLLRDEIRTGTRHNVVRAKQFSEVLDESIRKYQSRSIEATQVIEEMLELARQIREAHQRGEQLHLTPQELAFYDSLEVNDSAVSVLGTPVLCEIARELVKAIRSSVTVDWDQKESVRAEIRSRVKRLLRRYGYPPDKEAKAVETVLLQATELCKEWIAA
jgi:type I restriction enzyme, R subunit